MSLLVLAAALTIAGDVPKPLELGAADIAAGPRVEASFTAHGKKQTCSGVPLAALLSRAELPSGEALRGAALRTIVIAEARDGYGAAFSLAELDPRLGNAGVIVADRCDGKPLGEDGPLRLVAPKDGRAARSVRMVERIVVRGGSKP